MSQPPIPPTDQQAMIAASNNIMDIMKAQKEMDKVQALLKLLEIYEIDINIGGRQQKVLNLELITDYPSAKYVKSLVKNETWRESCRVVFHMPNDMHERLIGTMDTQFILKMNAFKRKREQAIVNGLKNEIAGTEQQVAPSRKKRFFGMI
jgi:hypothetical protein